MPSHRIKVGFIEGVMVKYSEISNVVTLSLISNRRKYLESYFQPTTGQGSALATNYLFYFVIL